MNDKRSNSVQRAMGNTISIASTKDRRLQVMPIHSEREWVSVFVPDDLVRPYDICVTFEGPRSDWAWHMMMTKEIFLFPKYDNDYVTMRTSHYWSNDNHGYHFALLFDK